MTSAQAIVFNKSVPSVLVENTVIVITGKKLNTSQNPFKAKLITDDGQSINLESQVFNNGTKARITLPDIPDSGSKAYKVTLDLAGGNVDESSPKEKTI